LAVDRLLLLDLLEPVEPRLGNGGGEANGETFNAGLTGDTWRRLGDVKTASRLTASRLTPGKHLAVKTGDSFRGKFGCDALKLLDAEILVVSTVSALTASLLLLLNGSTSSPKTENLSFFSVSVSLSFIVCTNPHTTTISQLPFFKIYLFHRSFPS